mmetsp:Transcript_50848/g.120797  ORF Transcript_50848/g.120797 Transcript_50848/m.120797 type:complete len:166 (-) Transcript_50848:1006-1503(-)
MVTVHSTTEMSTSAAVATASLQDSFTSATLRPAAANQYEPATMSHVTVVVVLVVVLDTELAVLCVCAPSSPRVAGDLEDDVDVVLRDVDEDDSDEAVLSDVVVLDFDVVDEAVVTVDEVEEKDVQVDVEEEAVLDVVVEVRLEVEEAEDSEVMLEPVVLELEVVD